MKKSIVGFILLFGGIACSSILPKYIIKPESDLYAVDWTNNYLNYIPLTDNDLKESPLLDTTCQFIANKKYSALNKLLSSGQLNSPDWYLAETLYHISKNEYKEAGNYLYMITGNNYTLVKELLHIDLSYELAKLNKAKNYHKFLNDYQVLIDKYPENTLLKKIVSLRIRYVRYNY